MLIQSYSGASGFGYGFGAAGLTKGTDFNCNSSICYAIGKTNDATFKTLQQRINALSGAGGFKQLSVDGFIGAATVAALQALGKIGLEAPPSTKEQTASRAPELITQLTGLAAAVAAQGKALSPTGTAVTFHPTAPPPTLNPAHVPGASPAAAAAVTMGKSKKMWWILGGLVGVAAVGGVGYVVYRRKVRG